MIRTRLTNDELQKEFFETIKELHPDLTEVQVKEIINTAWLYFWREAGKEDLPEIRIKYFGKFVVHPGSAKGLLREAIVNHKEGKIDEKTFTYVKRILEKKIKFYEDKKRSKNKS